MVYVRPGDPCGVNARVKVSCLAAGMVAGADSIDDLDVLRLGAMPALSGGLGASSTLEVLHAYLHLGNVLQMGRSPPGIAG